MRQLDASAHAPATVFEYDDYQTFARACLGHGGIKKLAASLCCHATYVSQVMHGKSHFNNEQAAGFCAHFSLNESESEYFINLVNRDRAGNAATRAHFDRLLKRQKSERDELTARIRVTNALTTEQRQVYYATWIPQAIHILCQIEDRRTPEKIAAALTLRLEIVREQLSALEEMGLVRRAGEEYRSVVDSIHLEPNSPLRAKLVANWRFKAIEDFSRGTDPRAIHYSSVLSLSPEAIERLRALIVDHLEETRQVVIDSPSERMAVFNLDFYTLA